MLFREISRQKNPQPRVELWRRKLIRPRVFLLNHKTLLKSGIKMRLLKKAGGGGKSRSASETARDQNESPYIIEQTKPKESSNGAVEESSQREKAIPSSILEKGIIYFFIRNRVGVSDAESVSDLQPTYLVLRPLPGGAKLGDGAIENLQNSRLLALPKKSSPRVIVTVSWLLLRKPIRRFRTSKKASSKDQTILPRQQAPTIINPRCLSVKVYMPLLTPMDRLTSCTCLRSLQNLVRSKKNLDCVLRVVSW